MKYLLDTNVIVAYLRGKQAIDSKIIQAGAGISVITKAELVYGSYKSNRPNHNLKLILSMLTDLEIQTINLNDKIIDVYGQTKAELENKGKKLDEFDLLIAATVIAEKLILVTDNQRHFQRIKGLKYG